MTFTQLTAFANIAEYGNFTKAGQALNMTQPAVSHAIASLEAELGVTLIIRDRKNGINLTDVGNRILVQVREVLKGFEKIEQEVAAEKGLGVGTIRVGTFPTASSHFLPKIIFSIQQEYPNLKFDLYEGTINEVKEWLAKRVIDVGILTPPIKNLDIIPLYQDKMIIALRDDHDLAEKPAIRIQDIANENIIICKGGSEFPVLHMFQKAEVELHVKFMTHNANTLLNMVQEGLGLAITSELSLTSLPPNVQIRELDPQNWRELYLAVPTIASCSFAVQLFLETAQKLFINKR